MAIPVETFFMDPAFDGTLQQQIRRMVSAGILSGRFVAGDRLPSSRKLAEHLGISRITVTLAYNELLSDDYIVSRGRSGYFVSPNAPRRSRFEPAAAPRDDQVDWARALRHSFPGPVLTEKPSDWRTFPYPFIYGQTDERIFDLASWRLCALEALGKRSFETMTADNFERDDPELVKHIAMHTLPRRGILARPEEILITMGAQNALWIVAQLLLGPGRRAAMEDPGYAGLRAILDVSGCAVTPVPVDRHGIAFERIGRDTDVVFTTPSHQCPTNLTMPADRRRALLTHAARHDHIVVEDDYEFEISFLSAPVPTLKSLDRDGRVIHVGSFSKSLFPGLRLGYLVATETFIREARALRAVMLRHPPGLIQRTVAKFLSLGHYDALVRRMAQIYRRRRAAMSKAILDHGLSLASPATAGGSSFWIRVPDGLDSRALDARLRTRGVLVEPGTAFFHRPEEGSGFFRLAYSSIAEDRIADGIAILAEELRAS